MRGQSSEKGCKFNWLPPLKPTLTPLQFTRLTAARDAQLATERLHDTAASAQKRSPAKRGDEQDDSTGVDRLSSLCNHDVACMLRALRAVPCKPLPSHDWLGTPAQRARAAVLLAARLPAAPPQAPAHAAGAGVATCEHDRISDTGGSAPRLPSTDNGAAADANARLAPGALASHAGAPEASARAQPAWDAQEHIRKLEGKVLAQRKRAERERAAQEVKAARSAARKAQARSVRLARSAWRATG